jgi:hypothetical protein
MNPSSCFRKRTEDAGQVAAKRAVKNVTAEPPCDKLKTGVTMERDFVESRNDGLYLIGSRVPIDRVVWEYRNGEDPETIQSHYLTLSLEQVDGAIAFYLNHKDEVEQVMEERRREEDAYTAAHPTPPDIKEKFERMRRQMLTRRS